MKKERVMLSEAQLAEFRKRLEDEKAELLARKQTLNRRLARDDHYIETEDLGDSAVQVFSKEETLFEHNQIIERLSEIDHALGRLGEGTYGLSEVSGKPIPVERLRAIPTATTLVDEHAI